MKRFHVGVLGLAATFGIIVSSCGQNSSGGVRQDEIGKLEVNPKVSECGGFEPAGKVPSSRQTDVGDCRDELLHWSYDSNARTVTFLNKNVRLNCCGERSVGITMDEATGRYAIRESDTPLGEGRCLCTCFFDFSVGLSNISAQPIDVELYRHVTDSGPEQHIWQGTLNLQQGSGEIVTQKDIAVCE